MKTILKGLSKRKKSVILILAELFFTLLYFIIVMCNLQETFIANIEMPKQVDCDTDKLLSITFNDSLDGDVFQAFKEEIMKNEEVESCSIFCDDYLFSGQFEDEMLLRITEDSNKIKDIKVENGMAFSNEDFGHDDRVNVIIGKKIADKYEYNVGDTINLEDQEEKFVVKGIIKAGQTLFFQTFDNYSVIELDDVIIYPINEEKLSNTNCIRAYCKLKDNYNVEKIKKDVSKIAIKNGFYADGILVSDVLKECFEKNYNSNKSWIIISLMIIILNCVGMTTLISSWIYLRKYEIGVRMALGYTKRKINSIFIGEVLLICTVACTLACIIAKIIYNNNESFSGTSEVGLYFSLRIFIITVIIAILSVIPPIVAILWRIKKMQPVKLLGGKRK